MRWRFTAGAAVALLALLKIKQQGTRRRRSRKEIIKRSVADVFQGLLGGGWYLSLLM